jgi:hypothetical protein
MMSDSDQLLEEIEKSIVELGSDLGGWTRRGDGELQLFDGRVTLRADVADCAGAAVIAPPSDCAAHGR